MSLADLPATEEWSDQLSLAELVSRVLDRGAVITGEITISVAGVDLVFLGVSLVVAATETAHQLPPSKRRRP